MAGVKRNKVQRAVDREKIATLRLQSVPVSQIVKRTGLSESTVHRELRALEVEWRAAAAESIQTHKDRELKRLEAIEVAAWGEWERSKRAYSKKTTEDIELEVGEGKATLPAQKVKKETGGRIGDPRLLQVALSASEARRKLLGMDAPTKVAPTDPTGEKPYNAMTDAELMARIAELQGKAPATAPPV